MRLLTGDEVMEIRRQLAAGYLAGDAMETCCLLSAKLDAAVSGFDRRVSELLASNTAEVERRRVAEADLRELQAEVEILTLAADPRA